MLDLGDRLSSYEPLWENWYKDVYIGGGNFGKVYKLKTDLYGETAYTAVKVIPVLLEQELASVPDNEKMAYVSQKKEAMVLEIKNMFRLKDKPHLVQCINHSTKDIFDDSDEIIGFDILIQMNYYRSLTSHIKKNGQLSVSEIKKIAMQVADGLRSMHEINMLHRDIKPDNIYMDDNGNYLIGDFGISKQEAASSYSTMAGTQPFIAPEVWKITHTNRRYTKTADIYSFGITIYYLLNGNRLPLVEKGANRNQIDDAVFDRLNGKLFPPPENGSDQMKAVIMKCCCYEPEARYRNMEEVLDALSDVEISSADNAVVMDSYATEFAGQSAYDSVVRERSVRQDSYRSVSNAPSAANSYMEQSPQNDPRYNSQYNMNSGSFNANRSDTSMYNNNSYIYNSQMAQPQPQPVIVQSDMKKIVVTLVASVVVLTAGILVLVLNLNKNDKNVSTDKGDTREDTAVTVTTTDITEPVEEVVEEDIDDSPNEPEEGETESEELDSSSKEESSEEEKDSEKETKKADDKPKVDYSIPVVPDSTQFMKSMYVTTNVKTLNIRCGPGEEYKVVYDGIPMGQLVDVNAEKINSKTKNTWGYVTYNGYTGWVSEKCLSGKPTIYVPGKQKYLATMYVKVDSGTLTIRYGPSTEYSKVGEVKKGEPVDVYAEEYNNTTGDYWAYINYNNYSGWVNERYLTSTSPQSTKKTTTTKKETTSKTETTTPKTETTKTETETTVPVTETTPEITEAKIPEIYPSGYLLSASASSNLPDEVSGGITRTYVPGNLIDYNYNTCWAENVSGSGIGESIYVYNDFEEEIDTIYIANGFMRTEDTFYNNNRVKECTLEFSDGTSIEVTLDDGYSMQPTEISLGEPIFTESVRLTINSVYEGDKYDDTCISEIMVGLKSEE